MSRAFITVCVLTSVFALSPAGAALKNKQNATQAELCKDKLVSKEAQIHAAAEQFKRFFNDIEGQLFERDYFLRVAKLALLAKEHVLMFGPPGNAKSMAVDLIIDNIVDENGEPSVFKIQMTPETTLSETHGTIDFKKMMKENIQTRQWEQGMLSARFVFLDEVFDARANAIRNNLMALNEREHAQGRERIKGITETGFAATNRYINEVYERAGDDGPKAMIDRFAFAVFIPSQFELVDSALRLIAHPGRRSLQPFTFAELDLLRDQLPRVRIPDHVMKLLVAVFYQLKDQTEALEAGDKKRYEDQKKTGQSPLPPYRATKYYTGRTLGKASVILRAIVLLDWIESGGTRSLVASTKDVEKLIQFFTLNSANSEFLREIEETTVNPYEKVQIITVLKERELFADIYQNLMNEINSHAALLTDLEIEREAAVTPELREQLAKKIISAYLERQMSAVGAQRIRDLGGSQIADDFIAGTLEEWLRELMGEKIETELAAKIEEVKKERERQLAEERRREEERRLAELQEQRKRELEEARLKQEEERKRQLFEMTKNLYKDPAAFTMSKPLPDSGENLKVAKLSDSQFVFFGIEDQTVLVSEVDFSTGDATNYTLDLGIKFEEDPQQIVSLGGKKFFLWFGNHGRVLDLESGLHPKKFFYEINDGQFLTDNAVDGELIVFDSVEQKLARLNSDLEAEDWIYLRDFSFVSHSQSKSINRELFDDLIRKRTNLRAYLHPDKNKVLIFRGLFGDALYKSFWLDLKNKIIEANDDPRMNSSNQSVAFPQKHHYVHAYRYDALSEQLRLRFLRYDTNAVVDGKYPIELHEGQFGEKVVGRPLSQPFTENTVNSFWSRPFDISPEGNLVIYVYDDRLWGLDLLSGEPFEIEGLKNLEVVNVRFLDSRRIIVYSYGSHRIIQLPVATE